MPDPREYTVGWICPTANELRAAIICLDKKHPRLRARTAPNDTNAYTLGEINEHNVVIANFPIGTQGLVSAATVAGNLVRSFPNVRVVLMVGIGGGAPLLPDRDIRLGDVVVSCPGGGKPGVVQYDFGKLIQGRPFEATMALNRPPPALLTGAMQLEVEIEDERDRLEQCIKAILGKRDEETREKFARPAVESDRLFRSEVMHEDGESCAEVCASDKSNIVTRLPRTQRPNTPRVFHGLIASANQLMKDAPVRDMYAREQKILCFEMEAAGLMNDFP
jgi:nucleoside phosphorylase